MLSESKNIFPLTIELVPKSSWYSNVRSNVSDNEWNIIRRKCYKNANYKCEICGNVGDKYPVECHETWNYDDNNKTQTLIGLISLCPNCHKTKHIGLAQINGEEEIVINQLMKINQISRKKAIKYIDKSFNIWQLRSNSEWKIDIEYLKIYLNENS